ncbi:hypothetical protein LJC74_07415 [Eubacteriales bacterium OttesenSCG-928-A19]|nr:hypothetical protein [Eubacteriales bacterium OttesenSCG-928-A19]
MAIQKCPRCELNYILDGAPYCPVCTREMKGDKAKDGVLEVCSICNENPALPGKDMCLFCLKEMEGAEEALKAAEPPESPLSLEDASEMEEIGIDDSEDIPDEIDRELSLDDVLAEEDDGDEDEQEEA